MRIPNYISTDEKASIFTRSYCQVNTPQEFDEWYKKAANKKKIYRGVCEAKFKNYTSAQRKAIINEISNPQKLIQAELENLRHCNENLHTKFCHSIGINCSDLYLMSFAQHFGGVSPLIDFSFNLDKALFFMVNDARIPATGVEKGGIENYMSLYSLIYDTKLENKFLEIIDKNKNSNFKDDKYKTKATKILENTILSSKFLNQLSPLAFVNGAFWHLDPLLDADEETRKIEQLYNMNSFEEGQLFELSEIQPLLIYNDVRTNKIFNTVISYGTFVCNMNIVAQNGCFIYFDKELTPLEKQLICVDIHKSLQPYIIKKYLKNITNELIFPDPYGMVNQSLNLALAQI